MGEGVVIKKLRKEDITENLFSSFIRRQAVDLCWRKIGEKWEIKSDPFLDDWSEDDRREVRDGLKRTIETGGIVYGAFENGLLKGFCSVESQWMGHGGAYLDLTNLHVSEDRRGRGIGKRLFLLAADWARGRGAKKLYLSAHSAAETQRFYRGLGCVDAFEYSKEHVAAEPFDCQLEYVL